MSQSVPSITRMLERAGLRGRAHALKQLFELWRNPGMLPSYPPAPVVVVSPHFDDAVFSCWSVLTAEEAVDVVTVFTAGPRDGRIAAWDGDSGVTSRERMLQRERENENALGLAGARPTNLGLLQATYGGGRVNHGLLRACLAGASAVYVPAGTGLALSHPEHAVVRDACLAVRSDCRLYADNPYSGFRSNVDLPAALSGSFERRVVRLTPEQRMRKAEAIRCYAGELRKLEKTFGAVADPATLEFEVLWIPAAAVDPSLLET